MGTLEKLRAGGSRGVSCVQFLLVGGIIIAAGVGMADAPLQIPPRSKYSPPDVVMRSERRFQALRDVLTEKKVSGALGYVTFLPAHLPKAEAREEAYFSAQFALLPWALDLAVEKHFWVVADFIGAQPDAQFPPMGFVVERDFGDGVILLRRAVR